MKDSIARGMAYQYGSRYNWVIDGNFQVAQVATTATNPANGTYPVFDMWKYSVGGTGNLPSNIILSQQTLTVGELSNSYNFMRLNVDGAGSGELLQYTSHHIEAGTRNFCGDGKKVTISFYARSSITNKRLGIRFVQRYGTGGSPSSVEVINGTNWTLTSTWTKYTHTFTTNTLSGKSFGTANDDYVSLDFWTAWSESTKSGIDSSTVETFVGAGNIDIAQVQLDEGSVALPFRPLPFSEESRRCMRYLQRLRSGSTYRMGYVVDASNIDFLLPQEGSMRIRPVLVGTSDSTNWDVYTMASVAQSFSSLTVSSPGQMRANKLNHGLTDCIIYIKNTNVFLDSRF